MRSLTTAMGFLLFSVAAVLASDAPPGALQDAAKTPGAIVPGTTAQMVCKRGYLKGRPRHVTISMKKQALAAYGIPWSEHAKYEVDHLVPRCAAGADDLRNLWPEEWPWAHEKDKLEVYLCRRICDKKNPLPVTEVQKAFMTNWWAYYSLLQRIPGGSQDVPFDQAAADEQKLVGQTKALEEQGKRLLQGAGKK